MQLALLLSLEQMILHGYPISVYNDASSPRLDNWIQPQLIPQASGLASNGYAIGLYNGQPVGAVGTFQVTNFANLVNGGKHYYSTGLFG